MCQAHDTFLPLAASRAFAASIRSRPTSLPDLSVKLSMRLPAAGALIAFHAAMGFTFSVCDDFCLLGGEILSFGEGEGEPEGSTPSCS